ncbi:MAG: pentapeptide repeat-containing protein, partial [Rubripirellula sp.]
MAKRKSVGSRPSWTGKYAGCKFLFAGKQSFLYKSTAIALLKLYGAKVCEKLDQSIDYLVTGQSGKAAAKLEQQAVKLNGSSTASIQIVDEAEFHRLLRPTPQEAVEMLKTARGRKAWEELRRHLEEFQVDLSGKRFRGVDFSDTWLRGCDLDGTDFRKANLKGIVLPAMCDAKFDGANLQECSPAGWTDCSFKKADLSDGSFYYYRGYFEGNDFTDATMLRMGSDGTQLSHSIFKNANLSEAVLPRIEAVNCDFTGAKMMDANFRESDFSKSKFCRADLSGSAFSESNFKGADLRKAVLRHADLESCDLTGAKLDGADFTGAMLLGAKIPKTAEKKAKGLIDRPLLKKAGPAIKKLLQVASSAASLRTSATLKTESGSVQMTFEVQAKFYGEFESLLTLDGKTKPRRFHVPSGYGNRTPLEPIWMTSVSRFC